MGSLVTSSALLVIISTVDTNYFSVPAEYGVITANYMLSTTSVCYMSTIYPLHMEEAIKGSEFAQIEFKTRLMQLIQLDHV